MTDLEGRGRLFKQEEGHFLSIGGRKCIQLKMKEAIPETDTQPLLSVKPPPLASKGSLSPVPPVTLSRLLPLAHVLCPKRRNGLESE